MEEVETAPSILKKLSKVFNGLVEVKVITIIDKTSVKVTKEGTNRTTTDFTPPTDVTDAFVTVFNLLDGDATHIIPPSLKDDAELRDFHSAQVDKSLKVLPQNIEALVNLGKGIVEISQSAL